MTRVDRRTDLSVWTHFWQSRHPCEAVLGLVLGTTSAPDAPHRTPVGPKLEPTGLSSAEVTPQVGPKWAPVRPNLWPRTAAFDPSQLLVGPSRPASLLSVKFPGCGRFSSRSDIYIYVHITHTYQITITYHKYMGVSENVAFIPELRPSKNRENDD